MKLSALEMQALLAWKETSADFGYLSFATIAQRSGLERYRIRRTVRALARKDMVAYSRGLWTDDGIPAGSGYGLTETGRTHLNSILLCYAENAIEKKSGDNE